MAQITAMELANELGTDSRTVRKFLRKITPKDEQPGKGARWSIDGTKRSVNKLRKQFDEWNTPAEEPEPEVEVDETEVEDAEMLDD